jgi:sterol desaturase/sphingolipid hydroxylase (fatty acid hydroxylase superfamily)
MGFAAHLRSHWMEPVIYSAIKYIPLAIIGGFSAQDIALIHFFNITIGHLNQVNINWNYGFLKYVLNNPKMHICHHAKELPKERSNGVNFAITLSIWDYIFKTNYIPYSGRNIELGFDGDEHFPKNFIKQEFYPLGKK